MHLGVCMFFYKTSRHFYVLIFSAIAVIIFGFYFKVSSFEWIALIFSIGFVIVSEVFNTAIEIDIDLTSPDYHPFARDTKDVAAAAVVLSIFTAAIVGLIVFLPKIFNVLIYKMLSFTKKEVALMQKLNTPVKMQDFFKWIEI